MMTKKKGHHVKGSTESKAKADLYSPWQALTLHLTCGLGLASSFWLSRNVYSLNLNSDPAPTLRIFWVIEAMIVILLYSFFRRDTDHSSYLKAVGRGLLGLPTALALSMFAIVGAVVNALGAIALGAPVGIQYFPKTLNWSLLMSAFTFVPAASVYGSSWNDWLQIFAHTNPTRSVDYMICLPAHGAVIGAWLGAWPMPLDWERSWQEWPICVTYGAIGGYLIGMVASCAFVLHHGMQKHRKSE